jgi:NADH-quinone oxidoreductase subunit N
MGTEEIADFSGLIRRSPVLVICLALIMFSLVGLPPLAGFVGKFALFASLAEGYKLTGQTYLFILLLIGGVNTAISLFYYLRVVKVMTMDPESDAVSAHPQSIVGSLPVSFVALVTAPILLIMLGWGPLSHWSSAAAQQLFGG